MNGIGRLYMQLRYLCLNSFVRKTTVELKFIYLNGLPYKQLDSDEMNAAGRMHMQLSYSWLNNFFWKRINGVLSNYSPKLKGLLYKRADKDKINGIGRLYMQLLVKISGIRPMNSPKSERLADKTA